MDVLLKSRERREQLQQWLAKHGAVVARLKTHGPWDNMKWATLQLPVQQLTQLRSLELSGWLKFQLPAGVSTRSSSSSKKARSSRLTALSSSHASGSAAAAVAVLPQLQQLKLWACQLTVPLLSQLLSATALTKLHWEHPRLCGSGSRTGILTQEQLYATLWPHLQLLPQLSDLTMHVDSVTAETIAPLSNLGHLQRFSWCLRGAWPADDAFDDSGPRALLAALQHLTQLQHLQLEAAALYRVNTLGDGLQCFSTLTASTQLTALVLVEWAGMPVRQAAFDHIFAPGHVLPHLKVLRLNGSGDPETHIGCVGAAQIGRIAASCPALQQLELASVTAIGFDCSCLSQLPSGVTTVRGLHWSRRG